MTFKILHCLYQSKSSQRGFTIRISFEGFCDDENFNSFILYFKYNMISSFDYKWFVYDTDREVSHKKWRFVLKDKEYT